MLRMRLTGDDEKRMAKSYTANPEAYQLYLQGRYWQNKANKEGFEKGIEYFQQAIAKDPNYAPAYDGLANCYGGLAGAGFASPKDAYPKAREAALKALTIDESLTEAHATLGYISAVYDYDWAGGEKEIQRAIDLDPSNADAHRLYGIALREMGRLKEAIGENRRALELDPLSLIINRALGQAFYESRQYDQAIEQEKKTLELDPNFLQAHNTLGNAYLHRSMYKEGMAEFEMELAISPGNPEALGDVGYAYAVMGRRAETQKVLDQLNEISKQRYVSASSMARIYAGLGEKDKAFEWLEKAYQDRSIVSGPGNLIQPLYDPLRSDPRFAGLLRRMNLQP
jgi:tetratricopeptide (TPR) repeat protein